MKLGPHITAKWKAKIASSLINNNGITKWTFEVGQNTIVSVVSKIA